MPRNPRLTVAAFAALLLFCLLALNRTSISSDTSNTMSKAFTSWGKSSSNRKSLLKSRLAHAEKLWQQAANSRKIMAAEAGPDKDFPDGYVFPYNIWDFARPSFYCPHDLERIGTLGDGGKVVCGMTKYEKESPGPSSDENPAKELIVYSFGVNDDSSFEAALLKRTNARIWGYDYSVDSWAKQITPDQYSRAHFKKIGISNKTNNKKNPPMSTVQDLMTANGHSYIDIMKMDIEGAEFNALSSLIESVLTEHRNSGNATLPVGQLLVEIHVGDMLPDFTRPQDIDSWMKWWSSLEDMGLRPVNNEDNYIGAKARYMEYTLINSLDEERNTLLWE